MGGREGERGGEGREGKVGRKGRVGKGRGWEGRGIKGKGGKGRAGKGRGGKESGKGGGMNGPPTFKFTPPPLVNAWELSEDTFKILQEYVSYLYRLL